MVHDAAARGFDRGAEDYEKGRPGYPAGAVDLVVRTFSVGPGSVVVDVGAGTGKWTRLLQPTGATILAVEPVARMREVFARAVPDVEIVDGTAEALPVEDASVDLVTAAQAFHWVDAGPAIAEVARVLHAGGGLALVWNHRDEEVPWTKRIQDLMDRVSGDAPRYGTAAAGGWEQAVADHGSFSEIHHAEFRLEHATTLDGTIARVASTSYVSALPDDERSAVLDEVRAIVVNAGLPADGLFTEPYRTDVFWCHKR